MTADHDGLESLSRRYRRFALVEARGASVVYERLAVFISESPEILVFIASLPVERRQPNLFLAAVAHVAGVPQSGDELADVVPESPADIRRVMLSRTTQTNEPARCSVLLPVSARLPQPLALLEVGASAGLCLMPNRYDYGAASLGPDAWTAAAPPVFPCLVTKNTPLPAALPRILWRAGLDLNPIDVRSEADASWLETLIWPGQEDRKARLRAAMRIARKDPPRVFRGDLFADLQPLIEAAPEEATLVVFHSAVLGYVSDQGRRDALAATMQSSPAVWISNESPTVFPSLLAHAPKPRAGDHHLMAIDGSPVAWTGPHGQSLDWLGSPKSPA